LTEHVGDAELGVLGQEIGDRKIHDRDLDWLRESDYLVAEVTTPSLGVGYEIGKATEWGKPVLCLCRPEAGRSLSAMIAGSSAITVREYQSPAELTDIFAEFLRE
jgi:nucleoside 2-deoxyribosyltransferase